MPVNCKFHTNIDCCKKYMSHISGMDIEPQVGDLVSVYMDSSLHLYLKVVERTWEIYHSEPVLVCELHLPDYISSIPRLEQILKNS